MWSLRPLNCAGRSWSTARTPTRCTQRHHPSHTQVLNDLREQVRETSSFFERRGTLYGPDHVPAVHAIPFSPGLPPRLHIQAQPDGPTEARQLDHGSVGLDLTLSPHSERHRRPLEAHRITGCRSGRRRDWNSNSKPSSHTSSLPRRNPSLPAVRREASIVKTLSHASRRHNFQDPLVAAIWR